MKSGPLKWHGGKAYLADWIISLMPPHLHYVEPYFGGGAVLLARDPDRDWMINQRSETKGIEKLPAHLKGCSEVVNDINLNLCNFWRVVAGPKAFEKFQRIVATMPLCEKAFDDSKTYPHGDYSNEYSVSGAVAFFIQMRQSRQGLGKDFATLSRNRTRGCRNEQANAWLGCIEGLPEIHERLKGVVILNDDAVKVIKQQDGEHTLFYCDPPYLHETRGSTGEYGDNEMTEIQHRDLLNMLANIDGKFMLSGYHSAMYDKFSEMHGWKCHEKKIDNKASSAKEKEQKTECVWCNF